MGLVVSLLIGLAIGLLAKFLMPGKDPGGFFITALIGIAGSFIAHFIGRTVGMYGPDDPAGFFASVLGAVVLLGIYRALVTNKTLHH